MKKLTKSQMNKIAMIHCAGVILATESSWAFESSTLSINEIEYLDLIIKKIANGLLGNELPIFDSKLIIDHVRRSYK